MAKPVLSSQAPGGHVGLITPIGIGKLPQLNYENRYIIGFMQFGEIIFTLHHRFFFSRRLTAVEETFGLL